MFYLDKSIRSPEAGAAFVRICEENFESRLNDLVKDLVYNVHAECITLSGPTCSGKTTTANKLTAEIAMAGKRAMVLSIDDFFHERTTPKLVCGTGTDYDSVAAIDLEYLSVCVRQMLADEPTLLPKFDFVTGRRAGYSEYRSTPDDIIVFEGIQAVYPEVVALFEGYPFRSIFVCVDDDITVNGTLFTREEIRLSRRIVRDYRSRSASPEFTLDVWDSVRKNEEKSIFPYMHGCDYILNSLLPFEVFMIGQYAIPLLETVPKSSPHFVAAAALREKYLSLRGNEIDPSCLAPESLYHEFLG